jgi:hypothetical protein
MDEINDLRIHALERSDHGAIRHQTESGCVLADRPDTLASAIAPVACLRRPPTLQVIQGGRHAEPKRVLPDLARDRPFLVVVK